MGGRNRVDIAVPPINPGDTFTYEFKADKVVTSRSFSREKLDGNVFFPFLHKDSETDDELKVSNAGGRRRPGRSSTTATSGCSGRRGCTDR